MRPAKDMNQDVGLQQSINVGGGYTRDIETHGAAYHSGVASSDLVHRQLQDQLFNCHVRTKPAGAVIVAPQEHCKSAVHSVECIVHEFQKPNF